MSFGCVPVPVTVARPKKSIKSFPFVYWCQKKFCHKAVKEIRSLPEKGWGKWLSYFGDAKFGTIALSSRTSISYLLGLCDGYCPIKVHTEESMFLQLKGLEPLDSLWFSEDVPRPLLSMDGQIHRVIKCSGAKIWYEI